MTEGNGSTTCRVDVDVPPYRQTFACDDFKESITPEALRDFKRICIHAEGPTLRMDVKIRASKRPEVVLLGRSAKGSTDRDLVLALNQVSAAIERGRVWRGDRLLVLFCLYSLCAVCGVFLGWALDATITKYELSDWFGLIVILFFPLGAVIVAIGLWARPEVEVALLGQSRLWRTAKFGGPWVGGIIGAGIAKLLFG